MLFYRQQSNKLWKEKNTLESIKLESSTHTHNPYHIILDRKKCYIIISLYLPCICNKRKNSLNYKDAKQQEDRQLIAKLINELYNKGPINRTAKLWRKM